MCVCVLTKQVPSWPQLPPQRGAGGDMSSENGCPAIAARRERETDREREREREGGRERESSRMMEIT